MKNRLRRMVLAVDAVWDKLKVRPKFWLFAVGCGLALVVPVAGQWLLANLEALTIVVGGLVSGYLMIKNGMIAQGADVMIANIERLSRLKPDGSPPPKQEVSVRKRLTQAIRVGSELAGTEEWLHKQVRRIEGREDVREQNVRNVQAAEDAMRRADG